MQPWLLLIKLRFILSSFQLVKCLAHCCRLPCAMRSKARVVVTQWLQFVFCCKALPIGSWGWIRLVPDAPVLPLYLLIPNPYDLCQTSGVLAV